MITNKESKFQAKVIYFIICVLVLKLVYVVISSLIHGSFGEFLFALIVLLVIFFVITAFVDSLFTKDNPYGNSHGGVTTVGDRQFQALMDRYEKLCDDFIEKKQYKKAAYIQLKLLRNPYKAATILKEGHLYNEAANVYLKRCKDKHQAAECYELARSYTKSVDLYKELHLNEKAGDIYTKLKDTKKAHQQYQIVVDDYKNNYQYVKAALIYRKKMEDKESANKLLVKGWTENKDAVNCANNFFANFKEKAAVKKILNGFREEFVTEHNESKFLRVLQLEYNRDIAPKENIQDMAYELISKNNTNREMLLALHHFIDDDSQITRDIIRHRTGK